MTALAERPEATDRPTRAGRGVSHVLGHFAMALLAAAGVAAVYYLAIRTVPGQLVDSTAMTGADVEHPRITEIMRRTLNGTTLVSLVAICIAAAAIGFVRRRADLAVAAAVLVLGANVTSQVLKAGLPRPDLDGSGMANSFPSGHTTAAASVAFALILVLPFAIRGTVALIGAAYVTVIAVATVWAEWHRPSDTIGALLVVLAWGALASTFVRARRAGIPGVTARPNRLAIWLFTVVGAISALVTALGLTAVAAGARSIAGAPDRIVFLAGAAAVLTTVAGAFLIWTRLAAGDQPASPDGPEVPASAHAPGLS